MTSIRTARLLLRPFEPRDVDLLASMFANQDVSRYIGVTSVVPREECRQMVDKMTAHWQQHGYSRWAVVDRQSDQAMGWCGLRHLADQDEVELLYALDKPYWGRGFASEAAIESVRFGFEEAGLERIMAVADPANGASLRVMQKAGLTYRREARYFDMDVSLCDITREQYEARREAGV